MVRMPLRRFVSMSQMLDQYIIENNIDRAHIDQYEVTVQPDGEVDVYMLVAAYSSECFKTALQ